VYNALTFPFLLYGSPIWISYKRIKKITSINGNEYLQRSSGIHTFWSQRKEEILEELKVEPVGRETEEIQNKLATACNKNEQQ